MIIFCLRGWTVLLIRYVPVLISRFHLFLTLSPSPTSCGGIITCRHCEPRRMAANPLHDKVTKRFLLTYSAPAIRKHEQSVAGSPLREAVKPPRFVPVLRDRLLGVGEFFVR